MGLVSNAAFSTDFFVGVVGDVSRIIHYRTCGTPASGSITGCHNKTKGIERVRDLFWPAPRAIRRKKQEKLKILRFILVRGASEGIAWRRVAHQRRI